MLLIYFVGYTKPYLTEELLYEIIDDCEETKCYSRLIRTLGEVYSDISSLSRSFLQTDISSPIEAMLDRAGGNVMKVKFINLFNINFF